MTGLSDEAYVTGGEHVCTPPGWRPDHLDTDGLVFIRLGTTWTCPECQAPWVYTKFAGQSGWLLLAAVMFGGGHA